jgi:hypothetical protein
MNPNYLISLVDEAIGWHMPAADLERLKAVEEAERETLRSVFESLGEQNDPDPDEDWN